MFIPLVYFNYYNSILLSNNRYLEKKYPVLKTNSGDSVENTLVRNNNR